MVVALTLANGTVAGDTYRLAYCKTYTSKYQVETQKDLGINSFEELLSVGEDSISINYKGYELRETGVRIYHSMHIFLII